MLILKKSPKTGTLMFQYGTDNSIDGVGKLGFQKSNLIACVPLYVCAGKEYLDVFRNNFKVIAKKEYQLLYV